MGAVVVSRRMIDPWANGTWHHAWKCEAITEFSMPVSFYAKHFNWTLQRRQTTNLIGWLPGRTETAWYISYFDFESRTRGSSGSVKRKLIRDLGASLWLPWSLLQKLGRSWHEFISTVVTRRSHHFWHRESPQFSWNQSNSYALLYDRRNVIDGWWIWQCDVTRTAVVLNKGCHPKEFGIGRY